MSVKYAILTVGFDKNGEAEFGVRATVFDLTHAQMKELRAVIPVAIGVMEQMWRDEQILEAHAVYGMDAKFSNQKKGTTSNFNDTYDQNARRRGQYDDTKDKP